MLSETLVCERVAENLRRWRRRQRPPLTQKAAARHLKVSQRQYQRWELRKSTPSWQSLQKIANAQGITLDELLGVVDVGDLASEHGLPADALDDLRLVQTASTR